jgi:type I phosphodiesterase/nucleotide pyrophosphatase
MAAPTRSSPRGLLVLLPAGLVALGLLGRMLATKAWTTFTTYQTPFAFKNPHAIAPPRLVGHVVIVVVDGLAYHASRSMPFLNELRREGADVDCRAGLPSLSLPGRAVMMTGSWPEIHGQATNFNPRPLTVETLFQTARGKGLRTALAAGAGAQTLFGPWIDERVVYGRLDPADSRDLPKLEAELRWMGEATRALLREKRPDLFVLDFSITDDAGHGWGADSRQYREAAQAVDEEIQRLAPELDLRRGVLIVTADHGHTPRGGHGGPEESVIHVPLVLVGGPVRAGTTGVAEQIDLAPTVSALLGIQIPASSQGRPLLDLLDLAPAARRRVLESLQQQRENFVAQYVAWVSGRPPASPRASGLARAQTIEAGLGPIDHEAQVARDLRLEDEARSRLGALLAFLLLPLLAVAGLRALGLFSNAELSLGVLAAIGATILYHALFPVLGLDYSFSAVNRDEYLGAFFAKDMALAAAACGVAVMAAAAWMERRLRPAPAGALSRVAWLGAATFAYLFMVRMAFVYWRNGVFLRWHMPAHNWGFSFYLDALALSAVAFAGVALPLAAWLAARLARTALRWRALRPASPPP